MRDAPGLLAPAIERPDKASERVARRGPQPVAGDQPPRRLDQWQPLVARQAVQLLQGGAADAAARCVEDALEGEIVGRLGDEPQIGERVADLLALVKTRSADHAIRQGQRDEALLELAGLEPGTHQDRDLAQRMVLALQGLDLVADPARLLLGVPQRAHDHLVAVAGLGPQGLAEPASVVRDHPRRGAENARGRTIVFLEPDYRGAGEIGLEAQDVADLGAAPAVDRLVVVADAAQIAARLGQQSQPQILSDVGVLVLVNQQIAKAPVIVGEDFGVLCEEREVVQQKVAEIDGVDGLKPLLIALVKCDCAALGKAVGVSARDLVGSEAAVLPALDHP